LDALANCEEAFNASFTVGSDLRAAAGCQLPSPGRQAERFFVGSAWLIFSLWNVKGVDAQLYIPEKVR
jgi:hypothetical protein